MRQVSCRVTPVTNTNYRPNCTINARHCENCGSTSIEDLDYGDQGYTACCNELVTDQRSCRDHHGEADFFAAQPDPEPTPAPAQVWQPAAPARIPVPRDRYSDEAIYAYRRGWQAFMRGSMNAVENADDRNEKREWYLGFNDANEHPFVAKYHSLVN